MTKINEAKQTQSIELTPEFRLTTDGDRNFILERRHTVDPTKAPGYKAEEGAAAPSIREEWRTAAFYGFTLAGLDAAIRTVAVRSAWGNAQHLSEYIAAISGEARRLTELTVGLREVVA